MMEKLETARRSIQDELVDLEVGLFPTKRKHSFRACLREAARCLDEAILYVEEAEEHR